MTRNKPRRSVIMSRKPKPQSTFPFLKLPGEVRNMVYEKLLCRHKPIEIFGRSAKPRYKEKGPSTAVLYVNHQIHAEASQILYGRNTGRVRTLYDHFTYQLYRIDVGDPTIRLLRSGRTCTTSKFSGTIYLHVFDRFQNVEIYGRLFHHRSSRTCCTSSILGRVLFQFEPRGARTNVEGSRKTLTFNIFDADMKKAIKAKPVTTQTTEDRLFQHAKACELFQLWKKLCVALNRTFKVGGKYTTPAFRERIEAAVNSETLPPMSGPGDVGRVVDDVHILLHKHW